ncbi:MAG: hypothetical protein HY710_03670 [Candidatus Latescibacteria bacterium]|nr:hypothetical protein [Candidatus Latescibacterota bacterium]
MPSSRYSSLLAVLVLVLCAMATVHAEPYLAVREGLKCSACHVNRTGQGKRNAFGVSFTQTKLPAIVTPAAQRGDIINRNISEFLSVGADFRLVNTTALSVKKATPPAKTQNTFLLFEGNVYGEVTLVKDRLTFYVDEQVAPDAAGNREILGILRGLPNNAYVKVGRMFLPYGLRLWDFDAFIRSQTGLLGQDFGVEVGAEPGPVSLSAAVSNGEPFRSFDTNRGKQLTLSIAGVTPVVRVGGSFSVNTTDPTIAIARKALTMGGPFVGLTGGPVTVLGELDVVRRYVGTKYVTQKVVYGEANILFTRGVSAKVAYDYFDPSGGPKLKRVRIGFEPFITQFIQPRLFYAVNRPHVLPGANGDQVTLELHMLF